MSTEKKRTRNIDVGSESWIDQLSLCIQTIGLDSFPNNLVNALQTITNFDHSVVFAYHQEDTPKCLFHTFSPNNRKIFVDEYLKGPFLLDPFYKACERKVEAGLYRMRDIAPDRFYQSEYYRSYYVQTGLAEEICFIFNLPNGFSIAISLMRAGSSVKFSAREFRQLESIASVVISLAQRHWRDLSYKFENASVDKQLSEDHSQIENTVHALFSEQISPRETQVAAQVLEGHSSESIAKDLGISSGTVRIHRRNIYAKLQISSQQELFSIFFNKITADQINQETPK